MSFILPFIVLIIVVVFIHEYGHYYFAKKYGVGVTDFSIGFGKELFGWNDKSGTRWKICAIPLGGYVKFFGDRNVYSQADHQEILEKYNEEAVSYTHLRAHETSFHLVPDLSFQPNNSLPKPIEKSVTPTPYFLAK